jgi:hypothetical protein
MRNSGSAAVPQISRRRDGSAALAFDYSVETAFDRSESIPSTKPESGTHLRLVERPVRSRNRAMSRFTLVMLMLSAFVTAVIVFQATIAEQQLRLDALTRDLRMAEVHHDNLRQQRAELLMPNRLREEAVMMGMYQGMSTEFLEIPAEIVAEVMASTSRMNRLFADPSPAIASAGAIAPVQYQQPDEAGQP